MNKRRSFILLGLLGLTVIIAANFGQLGKVITALSGAHWYVIPLLVLMQLSSYGANAKFYQTFYRMGDSILSFRKLYEVSLAVNFANTALPAGGVSGTAFLVAAVADEVPATQAALSQLGRYVFTAVSYFFVLALGVVLLYSEGGFHRLSVRFTSFFLIGVLLFAIVALSIVADRQRLSRVLQPLIQTLNFLWQRIFRRPKALLSQTMMTTFFDEFYRTLHEVRRRRPYQIRLFMWALAGNLFEVFSVSAVFIGFGHWVSLGIVIAAYTFANLASLLGVLTNGIGVYEAGMVASLTALGEPFGIALIVSLTYRVLNIALFLPPGFIFYRKYINAAQPSASVLGQV
jgi:uncharacterized protein (TIRG00374 family)